MVAHANHGRAVIAPVVPATAAATAFAAIAIVFAGAGLARRARLGVAFGAGLVAVARLVLGPGRPLRLVLAVLGFEMLTRQIPWVSMKTTTCCPSGVATDLSRTTCEGRCCCASWAAVPVRVCSG